MPREKEIFFSHAPRVYLNDSLLSRKLINSKSVTDEQAMRRYFQKIKRGDKKYWKLLLQLYNQKSNQFPESFNAILSHQLQIITPAYREGENLSRYFKGLLRQFKETPDCWGVTIVINYEIPYKNPLELDAVKIMEDGVIHFLNKNPKYKSRLDFVTYSTSSKMNIPILPNSMARKVGEDLTMLCWMTANDNTVPNYLGMLDMDGDLSNSTLIKEVLNLLPRTTKVKPVIIRSKGVVDREAVRKNRHLFIFQIMWEGGISAVGRLTHHNPFALGRFGIFPAREYAISGGGMPKKLRFIDEDVRRGIQIAWRFKIRVLETENTYATSSRRELHFMNALRSMVLGNKGKFTTEVLETAAMIRMYDNKVWATHDYRRNLHNLARISSRSINNFSQEVPSHLIEAMVNAWYKFTLYSIFAIEQLWKNSATPYINTLREKFLSGESSYLDIQIETYALLQEISKSNSLRSKKLFSILRSIDKKVRSVIRKILLKYQINFKENTSKKLSDLISVPLAVFHNSTEDQLESPTFFRIEPEQRRLEKLINLYVYGHGDKYIRQ